LGAADWKERRALCKASWLDASFPVPAMSIVPRIAEH
jgi:hypothetical protein